MLYWLKQVRIATVKLETHSLAMIDFFTCNIFNKLEAKNKLLKITFLFFKTRIKVFQSF